LWDYGRSGDHDGKPSPQVWKTYRSKSGEGLPFRMLFMLGIGVGLWNSPLSGDARFSACSSAKS
jgi:hypothetical protein